MAVKALVLCALRWAALCTIAFWSLLVPWMNYVAEFHTGEQCFRNTQLVCQVTKVHTWQVQSERQKHRCCSLTDCSCRISALHILVSQVKKYVIQGLHNKALKFLSCSCVFKSTSSYTYPHILFYSFWPVIFFENNSTEIWMSFAWFWSIRNRVCPCSGFVLFFSLHFICSSSAFNFVPFSQEVAHHMPEHYSQRPFSHDPFHISRLPSHRPRISFLSPAGVYF